MEKVQELEGSLQGRQNTLDGIYLLREQFFTRLLLNLFESERQFRIQAENLNITFPYDAYAVAYVEIKDSKSGSADSQLKLYTGSLQVAGELISKYTACHVLSLDVSHFAVGIKLHEYIL